MISSPRTRTSARIVVIGLVMLLVVAPMALILPQTAYAQSAGAGCAALIAADKISGLTSQLQSKVTNKIADVKGALTGVQKVRDDKSISVESAASAKSSTRDTVRCMLESLGWTVAKVTLQSITRSTVNWINSGFEGSPAFVSDLNQNLSVLGDTVANNFFQQLNRVAVDTTGFNLTSPFQDQITAQLRQNYYRATGSLLGLNQYDLQSHSADPRAFLNGDFNQGGFNAFFSATQNPANNPFGAYQIASNSLWNQIDAAAQQRRAELGWGKGFLPWRGACATRDPKADLVALAKTEGCMGNAVRTPGTVIESQLENTLGTGVRQLELADSIDEIVGALMGQLVNQVLGPNGLLGSSQPSSGGGTSPITQATTNTQLDQQATSITQGVLVNISQDLSNLKEYRDAWQKILDAANAAQQACGVRVDITKVIADATAGVAAANKAITDQTTVQTSLQNAANSTAVTANTQLTTGVVQYQNYLNTAPTSDNIAYAIDQSQEISEDEESGPTLYTQMVNAKNSCVTNI